MTTANSSDTPNLIQPKKEKTFPVMEIFGPTIQGEGLVAGTQTHFIRFGLCDYKCTKCDSMHAVDPLSVKQHAEYLTIDEIIARVSKLPEVPWITLSGGNPAIHRLDFLVVELGRLGYKVAVETQGTLAPSWLHLVDVLTVSPKSPGMGETFEPDKFTNFLDLFHKHQGLNIKIPVFNQIDLDFAAEVYELAQGWVANRDIFYLSLGNPWPPGSENEPVADEDLVQQLLMEYKSMFEDIKTTPRLKHFRFLPQLHVLVWGNARGK